MFHDFPSMCHNFLVSDATEHPSLTAPLFQPGDFQVGKNWLRRRAHGEGKKVREKGRWAEQGPEQGEVSLGS